MQMEVAAIHQEMAHMQKEMHKDFMMQVGKMELHIKENMKQARISTRLVF